MTQPLCRYCGKPIAKRTESHYFGRKWFDGKSTEGTFPKSKQEAQRYVNGQIVSVSWNRVVNKFYISEADRERGDYIDKVTTWDGESYVDEFFCNGDHAQRFAYVMASAGKCTNHYNEALKRRK